MANPITLPSLHTQPALSTLAGASGWLDNRYGQTVSDADDINQCLAVLFNTQQGSQPLRPLFGCNLSRYLDTPINLARPQMVREIVAAVRLFEPRIRLVRVSVDAAADASLQCSVEWRYSDAVQGQLYATNLTVGTLQ